MAFTPFVYLDDNLADLGDLVSVEAFKQIAENINYLLDTMPVGSMVMIMVGLPGVPEPDPTIWKELDGTEITEENSVMFGENAPDFVSGDGKYMRGYSTVGSIGNYGGSNTKDLHHDHGGTEVFDPPTSGDQDSDENTCPGDHMHNMNTALTTLINFEPVHIRIKHYIKIR